MSSRAWIPPGRKGIFGEYLYETSRGIDESPIITHWEPKSISRETTFEEDVADPKVVERTLAGLMGDVVPDLRQRGYKGKTVTVKVRFNNFKTHTRTKTLAEMNDSVQEIGRVAAECLQRFELKEKVRLIGIRVGGLQKLPDADGDVNGEGKKMV